MNYLSVIKGAILTEKSNYLIERENKYTFEVAGDASKGTIKDAIEALYGVKVLTVNIAVTGPKVKRSWAKGKRYVRGAKRKAIVELDQKDTIKILTGGSKK